MAAEIGLQLAGCHWIYSNFGRRPNSPGSSIAILIFMMKLKHYVWAVFEKIWPDPWSERFYTRWVLM